MLFRPARAILVGLYLLGLILSGCQPDKDQPVVTIQSTQVRRTPSVKPTKLPVTSSGLKTVTPTPTKTLEPHLSIEFNQLQGVNISAWHPWSGDLADQMAEITREFNQTNRWGIKVDLQPYYSAGALYDSIEAGLSASNQVLPQVVVAPSEQLSIWSSEFDILLDLHDYISHPEAGFTDLEVQAFLPEFWEQDQSGDKQIGIPILRTAYVLFYNRSWAHEMNILSPPDSPVEFKEQACAAAVKNNTAKILDLYGTGGWLVNTNAVTVLSWLESFDQNPRVGGSEGVPSFDSPGNEEAVIFLRSLLDEGCAWISRNETPHNIFAQRKALFYAGTLQDFRYQQTLNQISGFKDEWEILPYTREDGTQFVFSNGYSLAVVKSKQTDLVQANKEAMAAWLFLRWVSEPVNQKSLGDVYLSIPVTKTVKGQIDTSQDPWRQIGPLSEIVLPVSSHPSWRSVRRMVEDAGWQVFHLPAEQVSTILPQLDQEVNKLLEEK